MTSQPAAWLKPSPNLRGLDHLGVRAPCEAIYSQLVPGITNVTDRARYYSFYPWLVWATEQHKGSLRREPFYVVLRRADCLLTLIAARHDAKRESDGLHNGMIGAQKLFPAVSQLGEDGEITISDYANIDAEKRYFQNALGGLGQYYLGTLREADILVGDRKTGIRYVKERAESLAEAFELGVDRKKFFSTLEEDRVDLQLLEEMESFCSCQIESNEVEQSVLADLFLNRDGAFYDEHATPRRQTLTLMLDLATQLQNEGEDLPGGGEGVALFRACAYSGSLQGGRVWSAPSPILAEHFSGWRLYHRSELFSVAVQALFWVGLTELREQGAVLRNSEEYRRWFLDTFNSEFNSPKTAYFKTAIGSVRASLPPIERWESEEHEIQLGWDIVNLSRGSDDSESRREVLRKGIQLLLLLIARDPDSRRSGFSFGLTPNYLAQYPVNLWNFEQLAAGEWQNVTFAEILGLLAVRWGVEAHIRVALRKMAYDSRDTFKIKPTDQGMKVSDEVPLPGFTSPRLIQSIQILRDIGALRSNRETGGLIPSAFGEQLLKECANG